MAKNHYINNKDFLAEMIKYRQAIDEAKQLGSRKPQIPTYVAKCFMMIAENLSHKPNFLSYTFRDEMVADAIENCVMYVDNFDPAKSSNPFAYFTQITYYAFLRRIQKEKKQLYVKYKSTETAGILDEYELNENEDGTFRQFELYENISSFIENYENAKKAKKEDYAYYNTLVVVNQPWVALPDNPFGQPTIKAKGGEALWLASSLVFLFGNQASAGINHITATKNSRTVRYAIRTKISILKNHVNGLGYNDGKLIAVPQGYIEDTKEALEAYKKEYSQYWNGILSGTGEITLEETTDDISE